MKESVVSVARQWRRPWGTPAQRRLPVDPETGLQRFGALRASAETELARAARFHRPLAALLIALHPQLRPTSESLQRFADMLRRHTRGFDLIGRADDGSFFLLLPEANRTEALAVADRIQRQGREHLDGAEELHASISPLHVGIATFPDQGMLLNELITAARSDLAPFPSLISLAPPAPAVTSVDERRFNLFAIGVSLSGACVLAASMPHLFSTQLLLQLLPILVLGALAERLTDLKNGESQHSLGSIALLTAAALGGPAGGALAGFVSGVADWRFSSKPANRGVFNAGSLTLSGAAAGLPYFLLGEMPTLGHWPVLFLPGIVAGLICFGVNMALVAEAVALITGSTFRTEWRLRCNWLALHYAIIGAVSLGLALLYQSFGVTGLLLLLGPVALLHYSQRQYVTHTAAHVAELSTLNQELTASNQRLTDANERLEHTLGDLRQANESMLTALCEALELRDQETEGHSQRVVSYARATATALGLAHDEVQAVVHGAHLHDIGKIGVTDAILLKPGPLTADEWAEMKKHPEIGFRMIAHIPFLAPAAVLVRHHHERWDGRGYPDGLAATAIPIGARIFNVVDAFDAMTSDRPYKSAMPLEAALAELARNRGTQFDPDVVDVFIGLVTGGGIDAQCQRVAADIDPVAVAGDQIRRRSLALRTAASVP